jgi:carbamoyltransferase
MAYNVLGIHPGHNSSAALVSDGELVYYLEEERLSRSKRDGSPFRSMIDICSKYKIDELVIGGTNDSQEYNTLPWTGESPYVALIRKYYPKVKVTWLNIEHHLLHASCAFYNSGFKDASILVIDGAGSYQERYITETQKIGGYEAESIWIGKYPGEFKTVYKTYGKNDPTRALLGEHDFDDAVTITKAYEAVTEFLGWHAIEGGKTMGLAPYGKHNPNIPTLFKNGRGNRDVFIPHYPSGASIDFKSNHIFERRREPDNFHKNQNELLEIEADLAWQIQNDTQEEVAKLIEKSVELTGKKQICIAGGYGLNCVTNYWLKKRFPDLEIYHEPISHDGGTAIGAAKYIYYTNKKDFAKRKQTSIYYGPRYDESHLQTIIKNNEHMFISSTVTPDQIAKLISENNIVTIFQGRSEAGPRALGNRSILYNPTDPNGKDYVNKVKNREWFRPFAGSVLKEKAAEWFDMAGLEESPFMMYAMDVWPDKQDQIKAITHVDGTCRIQTVTEEQNPHYYKLIQEFEKITGVPILFNTSFNLAGDPLVETIEDALETMLKSEMKYMYVPELEMLLEKK